MWVMTKADVVAPERLNHPHILLSLGARQRKPLVLPHVMAANTLQDKILTIQEKSSSVDRHPTKTGSLLPSIFRALNVEGTSELI
jgi:hypothetical protein